MVKMAIAGNPHFELSEIEKERGGKSWTVETLKDLRKLYPQEELFLIIGSDQFQELAKWRNPEELFNRAKVCVMRRAGMPIRKEIKRKFPKARILDVSQIEISGKKIREKIRKGSSVRYLLPDKVYEYILKKGLYQKEKI
jgi:nicotinate-nucleotide adenylyltransferase